MHLVKIPINLEGQSGIFHNLVKMLSENEREDLLMFSHYWAAYCESLLHSTLNILYQRNTITNVTETKVRSTYHCLVIDKLVSFQTP